MWSKWFWREAAERSIKTGAQMLVLLFTADVAFDVFQFAWVSTAGLVLGAMLLSVVTSIASAPVGPPDSPSAL